MYDRFARINIVPIHRVQLQGKTFTGIGPTPSIAKNIAAEAAVHHIATIMSSDPTEEEIQTGRAFEDR